MFNLIVSGAAAYLSSNIDYLIILMLIFSQTHSWRGRLTVYLGDLAGSSLVVVTSLILAFVLHFIPSQWVIGLLGLIPIGMGIHSLFAKPENDSKIVSEALRARRQLLNSVIIITIATSADNLSIFVPLFASMTVGSVVVVLLTFLGMLTVIYAVSLGVVRFPAVAETLAKDGRWITGVVYVGLGVYVMWDNGTILHVFNILFNK